MIKIDTQKCIGCGLCVADCLGGNLHITEGIAEVKGGCMQCGHCYAICPEKAVIVEGTPENGVIELGEGLVPTGESLLGLMKSRRSIRHFEDKPLERETIARVLEAGRVAPTAVNRQDVRYVVVQDGLEQLKPYVWEGFRAEAEDALKEGSPRAKLLLSLCEAHDQNLSTHDSLFFNAQALLVVVSPSKINGDLASAYIELMANAEGLGVLFTGFVQRSIARSPEVLKMLGIEDGSEICTCMLIGYPKVKYLRSAPRNEAKIEWK